MQCHLEPHFPINDVYGDDSNKFKTPDTFYGGGYIPQESIAITEKASEKDLPTLFTFFNWLYTLEGGFTTKAGLSEEQYNSNGIFTRLVCRVRHYISLYYT